MLLLGTLNHTTTVTEQLRKNAWGAGGGTVFAKVPVILVMGREVDAAIASAPFAQPVISNIYNYCAWRCFSLDDRPEF
jgi:hypothetical protein